LLSKGSYYNFFGCHTWPLSFIIKTKQKPVRNIKFGAPEKSTVIEGNHVDGKNAKISRFTRRLEKSGDLDEVKRKLLLEITNKCPIRRTLQRRNFH